MTGNDSGKSTVVKNSKTNTFMSKKKVTLPLIVSSLNRYSVLSTCSTLPAQTAFWLPTSNCSSWTGVSLTNLKNPEKPFESGFPGGGDIESAPFLLFAPLLMGTVVVMPSDGTITSSAVSGDDSSTSFTPRLPLGLWPTFIGFSVGDNSAASVSDFIRISLCSTICVN